MQGQFRQGSSGVLDVLLTNRCNLKCKMCDMGQGLWQADRGEDDLTPDQWLAIVEKLGVNTVCLNGWEPLLYERFDELVEKLSPGRQLFLITNGTLIDKWFDSIVKYIDGVTVSLDGMPEVHNRIRGVPGTWTKAYVGLVRLHLAGKPASVSYAITPDNIPDMVGLSNTLEQYAAMPLLFNHYNFIHPLSADDECDANNMAVYDPTKMNTDTLWEAVKMCSDRDFLPALSTKAEIEEYYHNPPTSPMHTDEGCKILNWMAAGHRYIVDHAGRFCMGNRCWMQKDLGDAMTDPPPCENEWVLAKARGTKAWLPSQCQRLCCSGKTVHGEGRRVAQVCRDTSATP